MKPDEDPNRDVYFKDGLRIFRVAKNPNAGPDAGTVYALTVKESVSAEKALAGFPMPRDGESSMSYLASDPGACGSLWPEGMGVELRQVSPQGLPISNEEYAKHARLYFDLQHTENGGLTGRGASIVEGRFLYTNVRLTRLERDRP